MDSRVKGGSSYLWSPAFQDAIDKIKEIQKKTVALTYPKTIEERLDELQHKMQQIDHDLQQIAHTIQQLASSRRPPSTPKEPTKSEVSLPIVQEQDQIFDPSDCTLVQKDEAFLRLDATHDCTTFFTPLDVRLHSIFFWIWLMADLAMTSTGSPLVSHMIIVFQYWPRRMWMIPWSSKT